MHGGGMQLSNGMIDGDVHLLLSHVQGGGVRMNNGKIDDEMCVVQEGDLIEGRLLLIAAGKKNKMLVRVV